MTFIGLYLLRMRVSVWPVISLAGLIFPPTVSGQCSHYDSLELLLLNPMMMMMIMMMMMMIMMMMMMMTGAET